MIYLDNAATTLQKPREVYDAVLHAMHSYASVGRSGHRSADLAAERVYQCRALAAQLFDASPEQIVFTSNATHGLNIAIHSLISPGDQVIISGFEHNAVLRPLHYAGAEITVAGRKLFDPEDTLNSFDRCITPDTKAVICTHVSNVFGYVLPVEQIAELCHLRNVPFILDASQSAGVQPISVHKLHASCIAMPGHKGLLGPQGTGILLCDSIPKPLVQGGTGSRSSAREMPDFLPDRAEAGTHNVPGICGLYEGMRFLQSLGLNSVKQHETALLQMSIEALDGPCRVYFDQNSSCQAGVLSFQIEGLDCEEGAARLAQKDIAVRAGLHCAPLAHESADTSEQGTVRISFSPFTTAEELSLFLEIMQKDLLS